MQVEVESIDEGRATLTLPGGHRISCPSATTTTGSHHLSIRPERLTLSDTADLTATVERVVYLGTDLQVHVRLPGGTPFTLRLQNAARVSLPEPGQTVGLQLEEGAARLLAD